MRRTLGSFSRSSPLVATLAAALSFAACDDDKAGQVADTASDVADTTDTTDATDSGADTELADTAPDVSDDSVGPDTEDVADTVDPDVISLEVIEVDATNYDAIEPPPLPQGVTDGQGLVVDKVALDGFFLFGMGADPSGVVASIGGGAGGLAPMKVLVNLVAGQAGGTAEIRAVDPNSGRPIMSAAGLVEAYPYTDVDADTVRIDFTAPSSKLEIALSSNCRYSLTTFALAGDPVYADGLMTWPSNELYTRSGQCGWAPREARGLHVHYLRHADVGRDFQARAVVEGAPFGFFQAGSSAVPVMTRLPGIAVDEPPQTLTYYLSTSFPEQYVPAAIETFDAWNDALEEITGRRPFAVERAPAGMIAWDPRFHSVLWDESGSGGAVAPFAEDPDTGEIFQSFVVMWFGGLDDLVASYSDFFTRHPEVGDAIAPLPTEPTPPADPSTPAGFFATPGAPALPFATPDARDAAQAFANIEARARTIARASRPLDLEPRVLSTRAFVSRPLDRAAFRDLMRERDRLGRDFTNQELARIVIIDFLLHELGHNLGLRHNFIASADKHREKAAHSASSTMDYVVGMLDPGSYDRDAMRYAYGKEGPHSTEYLYCTDETTELEPACIPWDFGNPLRYQFAVVDALLADTPPTARANIVDQVLQNGELDAELTRLRSFVNTTYETWDETPIVSVEELLARIDCRESCVTHPRLRGRLALYMLYSRHQVTAYWLPNYPNIWLDFPAYNETQAALVMDSFFALITRAGEPLALKTAIIDKLPTSAVAGAVELLRALGDHYAAIAAPTADELSIKASVDAAIAKL